MDKLQQLQQIDIEEYNYPLPGERIAKYPLPQRDTSKLLLYKGSEVSHYHFYNLPELLPAGSFLFFNNTKVIPARLFFNKATGALIEIFLLHPVLPSRVASVTMAAKRSVTFECLVGNLKKWKNKEILQKKITVNDTSISLSATLTDREKLWVELSWDATDVTFSELLEYIGQIPIPPYLDRDSTDADRETYQTVYAQNDGSVAAPTAGLHFTDKVFEELDKKGMGTDFLTLHVGAGTFQPVKVKNLREHPMHNEQVVFSLENCRNILAHHAHAIAVGTTSTRSMESLYWFGVKLITGKASEFFIDKLDPYTLPQDITAEESIEAVISYMNQAKLDVLIGETELLIAPGYDFKICKGLITNFHQPTSTLLLLVDAFVKGRWKTIYNAALANDYRFLSYGDSSLLIN